MSQLFNQILSLVTNGQVLISAHGYDELAQDNIIVLILAAGLMILLGESNDKTPYFQIHSCERICG